MQGPQAVLNVITVPPGAGLGQRIVIDGTRGAIFEYDASNNLVGSWASKAGTDPYGHVYPSGLQIQGVIEGTAFILNSSGFFLYSSTPGAGNLIGAWTSSSGVDQFGNSYPGGFFMGGSGVSGAYFRVDQNGVLYLFNAAGNNIIRLNPSRQAIYVYNSSGGGSGNLIAAMASVGGTDPFGNAVDIGVTASNIADTITAQMTGGQFNLIGFNTSVPAGLVFFGTPATQNVTLTSGIVAGNTAATLELIDSGGLSGVPTATLTAVLNTSADINWTSPGGQQWNAPGALAANFTVNTVTGTSFANLTNFTVDASDSSTGSVYKITAWGNGQWGSTAQQLNMELTVGGTQLAEVAIAAAAFSASAVFLWKAELILAVQTLGTGGTCQAMLSVTVTQDANATSGLSAADNSVTVVGLPLAAVAMNTTVANVFELAAQWGSTTGAPTISKRVAFFEKIV